MPSLHSRSTAQLFTRCPHHLSLKLHLDPKAALQKLAAHAPDAADVDFYGRGSALEKFERRVARWAGMEAAVFMPTGILAQQIALRIWCERAGIKAVGLHPLSHLRVHELDALTRVHGIRMVDLCASTEQIGAVHLARRTRPLGALALELPLRELGCELPSWAEFKAVTAAARKRGLRVHADGARLWESLPHWRKRAPEVTRHLDSLYLSFYKSLGGLAGAALCGSAKFIKEAREWQRRLGGNLIRLFPYAVSAELGFDQNLRRVPIWVRQAREVAALFAAQPGIAVTPDPPHTNQFHVRVDADRDRVVGALIRTARETGVVLSSYLWKAPHRRQSMLEIAVGEPALKIDPDLLARAIARFGALSAAPK